jgi:transposase
LTSTTALRGTHLWLRLERQRVPEGGVIADAIDYRLNRRPARTAYPVDGDAPSDNNQIDNLMRPWAMVRKAWLFAGSEHAGQRAAVVMNLVQSARTHGHDLWAYLSPTCLRACPAT